MQFESAELVELKSDTRMRVLGVAALNSVDHSLRDQLKRPALLVAVMQVLRIKSPIHDTTAIGRPGNQALILSRILHSFNDVLAYEYWRPCSLLDPYVSPWGFGLWGLELPPVDVRRHDTRMRVLQGWLIHFLLIRGIR